MGMHLFIPNILILSLHTSIPPFTYSIHVCNEPIGLRESHDGFLMVCKHRILTVQINIVFHQIRNRPYSYFQCRHYKSSQGTGMIDGDSSNCCLVRNAKSVRNRNLFFLHIQSRGCD